VLANSGNSHNASHWEAEHHEYSVTTCKSKTTRNLKITCKSKTNINDKSHIRLKNNKQVQKKHKKILKYLTLILCQVTLMHIGED